MSPAQINTALDELSSLRHPLVARRLRNKINVCVQWANQVANISNPKICFREFSTIKCGVGSSFPAFTSNNGNVSEVRGYDYWMHKMHEVRFNELGEETVDGTDDVINLAGGRLLVMEPCNTTYMGVSSAETNALFDLDDLPPIGLWVEYIQTPEIVPGNPKFHPAYFRDVGYILSYIPSSFVDLVQRGIEVNAEECIYWLENQEHISGEIIRSWETMDKS